MNARIFFKEVRFNLTVVSGEHLKMKSMTFVSFHRIYFLFYQVHGTSAGEPGAQESWG